METSQPPQFLRLKKVIEITGLCRSAIYDGMKNGTFPAQVQIGPRTVAWVASEIYTWVERQIAARQAKAA